MTAAGTDNGSLLLHPIVAPVLAGVVRAISYDHVKRLTELRSTHS